jgi:acyl phosphate:glycerol-3-phosphate acyltransferase
VIGTLSLLPVLVAAYLVGSIPTGVLMAKLFGWSDPRTHGSGHTGALNVSRGAGRGALILVAALDMLKGAAGTWLSTQLSTDPYVLTVAGVAVTVGHCWPVWTRFSGGMGLATAFGALLPVAPVVTVAAALILLMIRLFLIKHTPRAVIAALCTVPIMLLLLRNELPIILMGVGEVIVLIMRHAAEWNRVYPPRGASNAGT